MIRSANFRFPETDINNMIYDGRKLDKTKILELFYCQFLETYTNVILQGFTGSGKTFLACAIGKEACLKQHRTFYIRLSDLFDKALLAKEKAGGKFRLLRQLSGYELLIIDEWLAQKISAEEASFLFEVIEHRYGNGSTIFCTHHPQEDWHANLGSDAMA